MRLPSIFIQTIISIGTGGSRSCSRSELRRGILRALSILDMVPVGMSVMQSISIQNPGAITLDATLSTTDSFAIVDPLGLRIDTSGD
jgi:hypothetical protein